MDLSDVRMERVARVRTAIANGCYDVSSADLAQKLISNLLGDFR
jgi:anti-sigma28 factor (negative regulator of flagellin synthesis)